MQQTSNPASGKFFRLRYATAIRIWHWLTFLLISGSLITVLLVATLFKPDRKRPPETEKKTSVEQKFDPSKLDPQTKAAFFYANKIWDVHKLIGFGLCFLLLSRVAIEVSRKKEDRLLSSINRALAIPAGNSETLKDKKHYLLVKRGYLVFYFLIFLMAGTGLIMAFENAEILKSINRPAREIHSFVQYLIYAYILLHLIGVIRADLTKQKGIVSAMINGGDQAE